MALNAPNLQPNLVDKAFALSAFAAVEREGLDALLFHRKVGRG
jgi:hypothetical protein